MPQGPQPEAREVLSDGNPTHRGDRNSTTAYYCARGSTDVNGQDLVSAICANARTLFGSDVSIDCKAAKGDLPKETACRSR